MTWFSASAQVDEFATPLPGADLDSRPMRKSSMAMRGFLCLLLLWPAQSVQALTADELLQFFEATDAGAVAGTVVQVSGAPLSHYAGLQRLYRQRDHRPLWTAAGGPSPDDLIDALAEARDHGLPLAATHYERLRSLRSAPPGLALELVASDAFLQEVRRRASGVVAPRRLDPEWHLIVPEVDAVALLEGLAQGGSTPAAVLGALWPTAPDYGALLRRRADIVASGETRMVRVPAGPLLRPGETAERVALLKARLLGPGDHDDRFDADLEQAVRAFQRAAGLEADGVVGPATLEVLNADRRSWIDRIDANLERWRWLPRQTPPEHLRVNIAAYSLRAFSDGEERLQMDVIVGRPYRRTPVFSEALQYLVVNPYWNVPYRLAVQDKLPQLKTEPAVLAKQGFEARPLDNGEYTSVDRIDWTTVQRAGWNWVLRQRPGPDNALGRLKFMLPNAYAVYLHDTPSRDLFARQERGFSSGCVRLAEPVRLAQWILELDGQPTVAADVPALIDSGETRTLHLRRHLPVYLVYFTAFADADGAVQFRRDIYGRDAPLVAALRGGGDAP